MIAIFVNVLVLLVLVGLFWWAAKRIAAANALPAPILAIVEVAIVIFAVLALLGLLVNGPYFEASSWLRR